MQRSNLPEICLIVSTQDIPEKVETALKAGIRWIQYREKSLTRREIFRNAKILRAMTKKYDCLLTVNDHLDIAISVSACGVHLGQDDFPAKEARRLFRGLIGLSTHSLEEALEAQNAQVDYIGFGPIFKTKTKKDALSPRSFEETSKVLEISKVPVLLIGGITSDSLFRLSEIGLTHVAVSSGILDGDVAKNVSDFLKFFRLLRKGAKNE